MVRSALSLATFYILQDEPALSLVEMNLQSLGSRGWHRYQIIRVIRNDRPAEFREDMGLATAFTAGQFRIPGAVIDGKTVYLEHTVGELRGIADYIRAFPLVHPQELIHTNLVQGYFDEMERRNWARKGRKSFIKEGSWSLAG